jgi:hypothetical protein
MFVFVVHGLPPELIPGVAFRRVKSSQYYARRKELHCPHCHRVLAEIDSDVKVELRQNPNDIVCHCYRKCDYCHTDIGINFASIPSTLATVSNAA